MQYKEQLRNCIRFESSLYRHRLLPVPAPITFIVVRSTSSADAYCNVDEWPDEYIPCKFVGVPFAVNPELFTFITLVLTFAKLWHDDISTPINFVASTDCDVRLSVTSSNLVLRFIFTNVVSAVTFVFWIVTEFRLAPLIDIVERNTTVSFYVPDKRYIKSLVDATPMAEAIVAKGNPY